MPPKKKAAGAAQAKKPKPRKKSRPEILPEFPEVPGIPLDLEVYEVAGLLWENTRNDLSLLNCTDLLQATVAQVKPELVAKVMKFLTSNLDVQDSNEDGQWTCARYCRPGLTCTVGAGSFGRVALLVKKAANGQMLDSLALKEADHMWQGREATRGENNLPVEVAINRDVNTYDAVHTAYLRGYKYGKQTKRGRLYLRHYKYGDLDLLHKAYIVYGHWLPEWFIYEVLRDLCKSLRALDQPSPQDTKVDIVDKESRKVHDLTPFQTIHQDIKPENTFLDEVILEKDVYKGVPDRPVPVIADFGEADYTHQDDWRNPEKLCMGGTPGYKAAEELRAKTYLSRGDERTADEDREYLRPFLATANNIWGIGRIVFELMTHIQGTDFGWALKLVHGDAYPGEGHEDFVATRPFSSRIEDWHLMLETCVHSRLKDTFPYSDDLRKLVADMLHPEPSTRPSIGDIDRRAQAGLVQALKLMNATHRQVVGGEVITKGKKLSKKEMEATKALYYTQAHWATIPQGVILWNETKHRELDWLRSWARKIYSFMDPEGPMIKQPKFMQVASENWDRLTDTARHMAVQRTDGKIIPLKDVRIVQYGNETQLQKAIQRSSTAVTKGSAKRTREDDHDGTAKQSRKRSTKNATTATSEAQDQDDVELDAESEHEDARLAKKTKKGRDAQSTKATETKAAAEKSKHTMAPKQKPKSIEAAAKEPASQEDTGRARRSGRTRKPPVRL